MPIDYRLEWVQEVVGESREKISSLWIVKKVGLRTKHSLNILKSALFYSYAFYCAVIKIRFIIIIIYI